MSEHGSDSDYTPESEHPAVRAFHRCAADGREVEDAVCEALDARREVAAGVAVLAWPDALLRLLGPLEWSPADLARRLGTTAAIVTRWGKLKKSRWGTRPDMPGPERQAELSRLALAGRGPAPEGVTPDPWSPAHVRAVLGELRARGVTLAAVARACGVHKATPLRWASGQTTRPDRTSRRVLADLLAGRTA